MNGLTAGTNGNANCSTVRPVQFAAYDTWWGTMSTLWVSLMLFASTLAQTPKIPVLLVFNVYFCAGMFLSRDNMDKSKGKKGHIMLFPGLFDILFKYFRYCSCHGWCGKVKIYSLSFNRMCCVNLFESYNCQVTWKYMTYHMYPALEQNMLCC